MSWDGVRMASGRVPQTLKLGDQSYWLMPIQGDAASRDRALRSELQKFDDPGLAKIPEFRYDKLSSSKKAIRLLKLRSGTTTGKEIFCELIEADFNNSFHVPTLPKKPPADDADRSRNGTKTSASAKPKEPDDRQKELNDEWKDVSQRRIEYEALSWCWGDEPADYAIMIIRNEKTCKMRVKRELALALKYLRLPERERILWIDAICINQDDYGERNHQVQMMSRIYTRAKEVCVWLGEDDDESQMAINFIREEIIPLRNFDTICSDKRYTEKWHALMMLMSREWFSRRWVVQEIALASAATVYCGPDSIPWKEFAVAVELFVEVETATHRLSEVMLADEKFRHVPGWFEYVSKLGASVLVQATNKVFRAQRTPLEEKKRNKEKSDDAPRSNVVQADKPEDMALGEYHPIDPLDRRGILSLEYLVSTMFIFRASECRDVVYSLLAIARDAAPFAIDYSLDDNDDDKSYMTMSLCSSFLEEKPFVIDYSRPYSDVCRDFVEFCIRRRHSLDPVQALDILCRPWALVPERKTLTPVASSSTNRAEVNNSKDAQSQKPPPKTEWTVRKWPVAMSSDKATGKRRWLYNKRAEVEPEQDTRGTEEYWKKVEEDKNEAWPDGWKAPEGWGKWEEHFNTHYGRKKRKRDDMEEETTEPADIELPSWVAKATQAPFGLYPHPGMEIPKTGRANADPLVGHPIDGHRNYSAAQTQGLDIKGGGLRFRKRPRLGHYSLYVRGFELDEVQEVRDASQGGSIPKSWLDLADWDNYEDDPPNALWRTLVADRGRDNRNPPYYYARACKESVLKGGIASGSVNTTALINNERNSIVAEFCRRVHAVIWGRCLFRTRDSKRLGLATGVRPGDKVCILYGCTVPVILRRHEKKEEDIEAEAIEDGERALLSCVARLQKLRERKARYWQCTQDDQGDKAKERAEIKSAMDKANAYLEAERHREENDMEARKKAQLKLCGDGDGAPAREGVEGDKGQSRGPSTTGSGDGSTIPGASGASATQTPGMPPKPQRSKTMLRKNMDTAKREDPMVYYTFVGESYVHGFMDGEALREKFYRELADRTFELR